MCLSLPSLSHIHVIYCILPPSQLPASILKQEIDSNGLKDSWDILLVNKHDFFLEGDLKLTTG